MKLKELLQRFHAWQLDPNPLKTKAESRICHGCGKAYEGDYCPLCGQKYDSGQVDWTTLKDGLLSIGGLEERTSTASFLLQLFGYGIWGTMWRTVLCLGSVMLLFGVVMMVSVHVSTEFWEGVSVLGFIGMIILHLSLCAGALFLGWWVSKKTKQI